MPSCTIAHGVIYPMVDHVDGANLISSDYYRTNLCKLKNSTVIDTCNLKL